MNDQQAAPAASVPAPEIELPIYVDSTMLTCFRSCGQKFYKEFVLGRRPPGLSIDLHAGACFATALEIIRKLTFKDKLPYNEILLRAHAGFLQAWGDFEIPPHKTTAKTKDRVWEAVEDYFATYSPLTDHVQPYMSASGNPTLEYTFSIPLEPAIDSQPTYQQEGSFGCSMENDYSGEYYIDGQMTKYFPLHPNGSPFLYCGRFDMLGAMNGRPIPVDEKTSGRSADVNWSEQWSLRNQFMGYVWACQQCGLDVDSLLVRGTSILKTKIGQAEAIKPFSKNLLTRWHEQLRRDMWRLRRAWDENYWDYNFGDTCTNYGNCIFMTSCQTDNPQWLQELEIRRWNPLEKNPVGPSTKKDVY